MDELDERFLLAAATAANAGWMALAMSACSIMSQNYQDRMTAERFRLQQREFEEQLAIYLRASNTSTESHE